MQLLSKSSAIENGLLFYFTGKKCKRGHIAKRRTKGSQCVICDKQHHEKWYAENKSAAVNRSLEWNRNNPERANERRKKWISENPEKHRHAQVNWNNKNAEARRSYVRNRRARIKKAVGSHDANDIQSMLKKQNYKCANCGSCVHGKYHVDHIMPISKGGGNGPENLQVLCQYCNLSKGSKDPIEWAQQNGRLL